MHVSASKQVVLTVSRQLGSGGSFVGQEVARRLGFFYADRAIIREAAETLSVKEETVEAHEESVPSFWQAFLSSACIYPDLYVPPVMLLPTENDFFRTESEVIKRVAGERDAVIIGRCGFHVLRDHPGRISVFLHAPLDFRIARYQSVYRSTTEEAEKVVRQCDRERANYCRHFTGCDLVDARNYDLSIDTSRLDHLDQAVALILRYVACNRSRVHRFRVQGYSNFVASRPRAPGNAGLRTRPSTKPPPA